ncbi:MAG TPA: ATP-binding protein [Bryobacteraceae bacterium]|nr:ATP-binding protein [Bryobacteraceae bacterium]
MNAFRLVLPAVSGSIAPFQQFARAAALEAGIEPGQLETLDLVLEEILINVARYAYAPGTGTVELRCAPGAGQIQLAVIDSGRVFNPLEAEPPDLSLSIAERPIGGLGVFLVRSLVESIDYRRENDHNVLAFTFPGKY